MSKLEFKLLEEKEFLEEDFPSMTQPQFTNILKHNINNIIKHNESLISGIRVRSNTITISINNTHWAKRKHLSLPFFMWQRDVQLVPEVNKSKA